MSDIFIPGLSSRFNSEKIIEDLMKLERVPKERAQRNIERIENEKSYWQELTRRSNTLRESARQLFSFQNPFNDRIVRSSDDLVITGSAVREAIEQERTFTVKQTAQADRFLSAPLEDNYRVDSGTYTFTVGKDEISFDFKGGTLKEFSDALNRRGKDKISSSLFAVKPGTQSLLIESKVTGAENRLDFFASALSLGEKTGMIERTSDSRRDFLGETTKVNSGSSYQVPLNISVPSGNYILKFETATELRPEEIVSIASGPSIPNTGSVSYGGIVIENDNSSVTLPSHTEAPRVDNMGVLSLTFSDGSSTLLRPISDGRNFTAHEYQLDALAAGKTIVSLNIINDNTHRDVSIRNVQVFDPENIGSVKPLNAVSRAQDAIISMEGIEITRSSNEISDLIPGVTITARGTSDRPVKLQIVPDRESVKDAIISFVGNYNRLMAEINILTRSDSRVIDELSYLSKEEKDDYRKMLGVFSTDSSLTQIRSTLMRIVSTPYQTSADQDLALLAQIGIGTDVRRTSAAGSTDVSRLRGYLDIDEKALDAAIATKLPAIKQLFGSDTTGELLVNSGIAFQADSLLRPYTETGGLFSLKTQSMDSRIDIERRRIATLDRQLLAKEAELKKQYGQMEGAFNRMQQMSSSFDRFQMQNNYSNGQ